MREGAQQPEMIVADRVPNVRVRRKSDQEETAEKKAEQKIVQNQELAEKAQESLNKAESSLQDTSEDPMTEDPMTEDPMTEDPIEDLTTEGFAKMFDGTPLNVKNYYPGDKVRATITAIGKDSVFIHLGAKAEGFVLREELNDADGRLTIELGDEIEAYVIKTSNEGIQLSTALSKKNATAEMLRQAMIQSIPVEGTVAEANKGGYRVDTMGVSAFCPHSQIALGFTQDPNVHVGQTYTFLLSRVEKNNVVVSRAQFLEMERAEKAKETLKKLEIDYVTEGTVSRVAEFGAFVDIGGIDGLVHVSELSWTRVENPQEIINVGDKVRVKVMRIENIEDPKKRRIALSIKALDEDPWFEAASSLKIGDIYIGTVQRLELFGAFVELLPSVDGLLHVSEIVHGRRVMHPKDVLSVGDKVEVKLLELDPKSRRIALSMKALAKDPWADLVENYPTGTTVQGTIESVREFGLFVALPIGVTALLPISQLAEKEIHSYRRKLTVGSSMEAKILQVEPKRKRLTLTRREDVEQNSSHSMPQKKVKPASMGTFGDLFRTRKNR